MSAETIAYAALSGSPGIVGLVGTRIFPDFVPTDRDLPAVAITRDETEYLSTIHDNVPVASLVTLEIWCMALSRSAAEALADSTLAVLADAEFTCAGRKPEMVPETEVFATVLLMQYWE